MTLKELKQIVKEEIHNEKLGIFKEEISTSEELEIRRIIRQEVSAIFFELFKKRRSWGA